MFQMVVLARFISLTGTEFTESKTIAHLFLHVSFQK